MTIAGTPRCMGPAVTKAVDGTYAVACACGWGMSARRSGKSARREHFAHVQRVKASVAVPS